MRRRRKQFTLLGVFLFITMLAVLFGLPGGLQTLTILCSLVLSGVAVLIGLLLLQLPFYPLMKYFAGKQRRVPPISTPGAAQKAAVERKID